MWVTEVSLHVLIQIQLKSPAAITDGTVPKFPIEEQARHIAFLELVLKRRPQAYFQESNLSRPFRNLSLY